MAEPLIPGGYILLSRKLIESEIWRKPPLYLKVWIYLLSKAQHSDYKSLKRGQLWTTYEEIMDGCAWRVGARLEKPNKDEIYRILTFLRKPDEGGHERDTKATAITTTKATRGMLIIIENYDYYQTHSNYENDSESDDEKATKEVRTRQERDTINKNDNNDKNDNNNIPLKKEPKIFNSEDKEYLLAEYLSKQISKHLDKPLKEEKDLQRWAADFNKMVRLDKYDINEIKEVLVFSQKNDFWQTNILSASKFRKQYLTLLAQMKRENSKGSTEQPKANNKFHNFNQRMSEMNLEEIASKRREDMMKKIGAEE
nr:MAG TPA: replisome organizer [Caudoviricetes sp.]